MRLAPLLMCVLVCLSAAAARAQGRPARLTSKQSARAEELLDALERAAAGQKLSASFLPGGDIRAEAEAAAGLLEAGEPADARRPSCEGERPGAYRRLCAESATAGELRLRKARLHVAWARAYLRRERGEVLLGDSELLAEAAAERELERELAGGAFESLRELEGVVVVYRTRSDFEGEGGALARVSFDGFEGRFAPAAARVRTLLSWLPETALKSELRNAFRSYADGRFWWSKLRCARVVDAAGDCVSESERRRLGAAFPATFDYTVAVNWRNASRHLARAARLLGQSPARLTQNGAAPPQEAAPAALPLQP